MQNVQNQLVTIVQDVHKKVNEMYTDWKATGFGGHSENNTKWIEVSNIIIVIIGLFASKYYITGHDQPSNFYYF
jgi:hypothetical protein